MDRVYAAFAAGCSVKLTRLTSAFADNVRPGLQGEGAFGAGVGSADFFLVMVESSLWPNSYPSNLGNRTLTLSIVLLRLGNPFTGTLEAKKAGSETLPAQKELSYSDFWFSLTQTRHAIAGLPLAAFL